MSELQHEDSASEHQHVVMEGTESEDARLRHVPAGAVHVLAVFASGWEKEEVVTRSAPGVVGLAGVVQLLPPRRALRPHHAVVCLA